MTAAKRLLVLGLALAAVSAIHAQDEETALPLEPAPSSGAPPAEFHSHYPTRHYAIVRQCLPLSSGLAGSSGFATICSMTSFHFLSSEDLLPLTH